jgi:serine/threonine-protein kinase
VACPRLGGRYELSTVLGAGAMAKVSQASDLALGRQVAVKVLDPALARDPEYVTRFAREARNAAVLPPRAGIVAIYDAGVDDDGVVYLVMELVNGRTLAEHLATASALAPRPANSVCRRRASKGGAAPFRGRVLASVGQDDAAVDAVVAGVPGEGSTGCAVSAVADVGRARCG